MTSHSASSLGELLEQEDNTGAAERKRESGAWKGGTWCCNVTRLKGGETHLVKEFVVVCGYALDRVKSKRLVEVVEL
jgi:hypothetical protein